MTSTQPDLILNAVVLGVGMHPGAWRYSETSPDSFTDRNFYCEIARLAEAGKLHALFLADTLAVGEENFERPNLGALDPTLVLTAAASVTRYLGLVATASTTYNDPYSLARRLSTLDHLSDGRAGWNVVTTYAPDVAANFGNDSLPRPEKRYERAEEFVDVVRKLWLSWQEGALIGDKIGGRFADASRVLAIDHIGPQFNVKGPSTLPRSAQGAPVLFQAGASEAGRTLAARTADAVFTAQNTLASAVEFRRDLRARTKAFGRDPNQIKIIPGLVPIIGSTEAEAKARKDELDRLGGKSELRKLALRVGVTVDDLELDAPLPVELIRANKNFRGVEGFRDAAVNLAVAQKLTVRELLYRNGGGHQQVVGTPEQIVDVIDNWKTAGAVDGFNLMIDVHPDGLRTFVDQVVPILQKRGLFRSDYQGHTLRENLGLEKLKS